MYTCTSVCMYFMIAYSETGLGPSRIVHRKKSQCEFKIDFIVTPGG